jgi:arylsulfatase A-like enzyme
MTINIRSKLAKAYLVGSAFLFGIGAVHKAQAQYDPVQPFKGKIGRTLKETTQSWPEQLKAPEGAPNVVWILLDDVGYGAASVFGGLIPTPTLDSLANNGLRYTNFHTTAICSPTRAALLTGRNSHSVHMGLFPNSANSGSPGYDAYMPFEKATVAEILRENGYNTFAVGKWHLTPQSDATAIGPFNRWPTGRGFDHYFGFLGGSTDQFHPQLWLDTRKVEKADDDHRTFNALIADKAINYIAEQKSGNPDKPFFLYYAPGATHAPHQVTKEWADKFKGKFDQGWDKYREEVLARQIRLGTVPAGTQLPPGNPGVKKWDELKPDEKKLYARFFEIYAAFFAETDYQIGRVVNYIKQIGQLDNTLIFVSVGDNGASKEGTFVGTVGGSATSSNPEVTEDERLLRNVKNLDLLGTEYSSPNYPLGWAQAANTPFKYWKQDANSEGGTHNPLIVFWPKGIKEKGSLRNQYSHVIDILPTTIELTKAKVPTVINGYRQEPIQGTSLAYSINNANLPSRHTIQHYEIMGSRSVYKDGWKAGALHVKKQDFEKDVWELYNLNEDFNERFNLAAKYPEKLEEMKGLFDAQAWKYNIYPLKDNTEDPLNYPTVYDGRDRVILYPNTGQIADIPRLTNRSFSITADVILPQKGTEGVLFSSGGRSGGVSLFVQNNRPQFVYNLGDEKITITSGKQNLPAGKAQLKFDFAYDNVKKSGGTGALYVNNDKVGEARFEKSVFRSTEGVSVGKDIVTAVTDSYKVPFEFTGKVEKVTIDLK